MKSLFAVLPIVIALSVAAGTAQADQLADVKASGVLVCATLGTSKPFSFQDNHSRKLAGYDVDICDLVARKLGVKVEYKLVSVTGRVPELTEKRVDIVAANLGWTAARAEQIAFSNQYFASRQMLMVRKESNITSIEQLKGRRIGAAQGTTSEAQIKVVLPDATVTGFLGGSQAYLALQQKKIDAQFASEASLLRATDQTPPTSPLVLLDKAIFLEPWGLGLRKEEPAMLDAVNTALVDADKSGELNDVFNKWFGPDTRYDMKRAFKVEAITDAGT